MRHYFDEETDRKLLEARSEEEVKAIIATTVEAEKLADKTDLVMAEIARLKSSIDEELDQSELDSVAGGAKRIRVDLSETVSCKATFFLEDLGTYTFDPKGYCISNDQCFASNEYDYHFTKYSNCKSGDRHEWQRYYGVSYDPGYGYRCIKCDYRIYDTRNYNFNS